MNKTQLGKLVMLATSHKHNEKHTRALANASPEVYNELVKEERLIPLRPGTLVETSEVNSEGLLETVWAVNADYQLVKIQTMVDPRIKIEKINWSALAGE